MPRKSTRHGGTPSGGGGQAPEGTRSWASATRRQLRRRTRPRAVPRRTRAGSNERTRSRGSWVSVVTRSSSAPVTRCSVARRAATSSGVPTMRVSIRSRSTSWSAALRCSHGVVVPGSGVGDRALGAAADREHPLRERVREVLRALGRLGNQHVGGDHDVRLRQHPRPERRAVRLDGAEHVRRADVVVRRERQPEGTGNTGALTAAGRQHPQVERRTGHGRAHVRVPGAVDVRVGEQAEHQLELGPEVVARCRPAPMTSFWARARVRSEESVKSIGGVPGTCRPSTSRAGRRRRGDEAVGREGEPATESQVDAPGVQSRDRAELLGGDQRARRAQQHGSRPHLEAPRALGG